MLGVNLTRILACVCVGEIDLGEWSNVWLQTRVKSAFQSRMYTAETFGNIPNAWDDSGSDGLATHYEAIEKAYVSDKIQLYYHVLLLQSFFFGISKRHF